MKTKPKTPRKPRGALRCWRCKVIVLKAEDMPEGWETRLATHLKRPKFRHICPNCILN